MVSEAENTHQAQATVLGGGLERRILARHQCQHLNQNIPVNTKHASHTNQPAEAHIQRAHQQIAWVFILTYDMSMSRQIRAGQVRRDGAVPCVVSLETTAQFTKQGIHLFQTPVAASLWVGPQQRWWTTP